LATPKSGSMPRKSHDAAATLSAVTTEDRTTTFAHYGRSVTMSPAAWACLVCRLGILGPVITPFYDSLRQSQPMASLSATRRMERCLQRSACARQNQYPFLATVDPDFWRTLACRRSHSCFEEFMDRPGIGWVTRLSRNGIWFDAAARGNSCRHAPWGACIEKAQAMGCDLTAASRERLSRPPENPAGVQANAHVLAER